MNNNLYRVYINADLGMEEKSRRFVPIKHKPLQKNNIKSKREAGSSLASFLLFK